MVKIIQNYALQQIIGEGIYGKIYKAIDLKSKQQFVVKVIPSIKFQQNQKLAQQSNNAYQKILSAIQPNLYIIQYVQMLKTVNNFYFIYAYCNSKTLQSLLKQQGKLPESKALKIFKQLIEAFKVNKCNIMHRDLKPDNIFFPNNSIKLGDFGICKTLQKANDMTSIILGLPIYMAPEVLKAQNYTSKADIWSLGIALYQMLFGFYPFQSYSNAKLISVLSQNQLKIPQQINDISVSTQNLLKKLLIKDQFKRIDWLQLLQYTITEQDGNSYPKKNIYLQQNNFADHIYVNQFKKQDNQSINNKRKKLLDEHVLCVNGIKTAINFLKSQQFSGLIYSYILFSKIKQKLNKFTNQLSHSTDLQDIQQAVSGQINQIQRLLLEITEELKQNSFDITELVDVKSYLKSKFKDNKGVNLKQWYDMINLLNGIKPSEREMSNLELTITINNFLL